MAGVKRCGRKWNVSETTKRIYDAVAAQRGGHDFDKVFEMALDLFDTDKTIDHSKFLDENGVLDQNRQLLYIAKIADGIRESLQVVQQHHKEWKPMRKRKGFSNFPVPDYRQMQQKANEDIINKVENS